VKLRRPSTQINKWKRPPKYKNRFTDTSKRLNITAVIIKILYKVTVSIRRKIRP